MLPLPFCFYGCYYCCSFVLCLFSSSISIFFLFSSVFKLSMYRYGCSVGRFAVAFAWIGIRTLLDAMCKHAQHAIAISIAITQWLFHCKILSIVYAIICFHLELMPLTNAKGKNAHSFVRAYRHKHITQKKRQGRKKEWEQTGKPSYKAIDANNEKRKKRTTSEIFYSKKLTIQIVSAHSNGADKSRYYIVYDFKLLREKKTAFVCVGDNNIFDSS